MDLYIREVDNLRFELSMNRCNGRLASLANEILLKGELMCLCESLFAKKPLNLWTNQENNEFEEVLLSQIFSTKYNQHLLLCFVR